MQFSVEPENLRYRQPNMKAAALHECSRGTSAAADGHAKGDAAKGVEHAKVTRHSQSAASQTDQPVRRTNSRVTNTGLGDAPSLAKLNPAPSCERLQLVRI
jgi:hypothetical protein